MKRKRTSRRRSAVFWGVLLLSFAALLLIGIHHENERRVQVRGVEQESVGLRKRIQHEGVSYVEKTGLTTMLLLGTDLGDTPTQYGARRGGQADFQMLVVIDPATETISRLQIDRDTIAEVEALGIFGNSLGLQPMQICLAHAFGATPEECAERAVSAVENLFPGLQTDIYMTFDLASIGLLNDALGGVTVTIADDFSAHDAAMTPGTTLTLTNKQAEIFVRSRMDIGDGSNEARMQRQQTYMSAAANLLKYKIQESAEFADSLFDTLGDSLTTNASRSRLANEANRAYRYRLLPVETLPGTYTIGRDGFVEFHIEDGAALNWVIRALYEPEK